MPIVNTYHGQAPDIQRWYQDTETKNEVPGVSSIVDMMPKSALTPWSARLAAEYAVGHMEEVTELLSQRDGQRVAVDKIKSAYTRFSSKAASEGTTVHKYAEEVARAVMNGTKPKSTDMPTGILPYLKSYVRFLKEFDVEPVMLERAVWNDEVGYAGRFDMVAKLRTIDDSLCMIDTKSGASGVWESVSLQQTAYVKAERVYDDETGTFSPMPEIKNAYGLWLRPEGFALIPVDTTDMEWEQFKRLRGSLEWKLKRAKKVIRPAINKSPIKRQRRW